MVTFSSLLTSHGSFCSLCPAPEGFEETREEIRKKLVAPVKSALNALEAISGRPSAKQASELEKIRVRLDKVARTRSLVDFAPSVDALIAKVDAQLVEAARKFEPRPIHPHALKLAAIECLETRSLWGTTRPDVPEDAAARELFTHDALSKAWSQFKTSGMATRSSSTLSPASARALTDLHDAWESGVCELLESDEPLHMVLLAMRESSQFLQSGHLVKALVDASLTALPGSRGYHQFHLVAVPRWLIQHVERQHPVLVLDLGVADLITEKVVETALGIAPNAAPEALLSAFEDARALEMDD